MPSSKKLPAFWEKKQNKHIRNLSIYFEFDNLFIFYTGSDASVESKRAQIRYNRMISTHIR